MAPLSSTPAAGDPHHQPGMHGLGMGDALDRRIEDKDGNDDQGGGVDKSGQDSGAAPSVGFGAGGGSLTEIGGNPGEKKGEEV